MYTSTDRTERITLDLRPISPALAFGAWALLLATSACTSEGSAGTELGAETSLYALVTTIDGVAFYPPLGPEPSPAGTFDPALLSRLRVALEAEDGAGRVSTLATFSAATRPGLVLLERHELYWMNVPAASYFTDPSLAYRFRALLDGREIGRSDMSSRIFEVMRYVPNVPVGVKLRVESRPAPVVAAIAPPSATVGSSVTITVTGASFSSDSVVELAGQALATTWVSAAELVAVVPETLLAAAGTVDVAVSTPAPGGGTSGALTFSIMPVGGYSSVLEYTGTEQTYQVPAGVTTISVKLWGAGGGSGGAGYGRGGAGGFARAVLAVRPGETLTVVVGGGGRIFSGGPSTAGSFGGGGYSTWYSGAGGGYSGIFRGAVSQANALIIAGGGGGGGYPGFDGGAGGGLSGTRDSEIENAYPGTQIAGGATGGGTDHIAGTAGAALQGGHGGTASYGGGGGGGYFGGGGGSTNAGRVGAGAGGAAYVGAVGTCNPVTEAGLGVAPPQIGDPDYRAGIATGGPASGGHGLIHITTGGSCFSIVSASPEYGAQLAWNTTEVSLSVGTNGNAACRYAASAGVAFADMTPFTSTGGTAHASTLTGLASGTTYDYYVKCRETAVPSNIVGDRHVQFSVAPAYGTVVFDHTGSGQIFRVPAGISRISVKVWGAGGGGGMYFSQTHGGAGGFSGGDLSVTPGESLDIVVGGGGAYTQGAQTPASYGGGGYARYYGGAGGGYSGVFRGGVSQATALVIAGGGGGGGWDATLFEGGAGGGLSGSRDARAGENGYPGSSTGGGSTGAGSQDLGTAGGALQGGHGGAVYGGGGGGGYFGGGAGATSPGRVGGGGGGSGFVGAGVTNGVTLAGTAASPPQTSDVDYAAGVGAGGYANAGGHGRVVVQYHY